jgi:hypothetical protein
MSEIVEGSQRTAELLRYFWAVQKCKELKIGQSLLLNESFESEVVKALLPTVVGMSLVAIDWARCVEIQRLPDLIPTSLACALLGKLTKPVCENNLVDLKSMQSALKKGCEEIKRFAEEYSKKSISFHNKYDARLTETLHSDGLISYTYLQRRCASLAVFRKNSSESSLLAACVDCLKDEGFFSETDKVDTFNNYGTRGRMFKVLK